MSMSTTNGLTAADVAAVVDGRNGGAFFNVARSKNITVFNGCCQTLTVRNTSSIPILVSDPSIVLSRPDLAITR